MENIKIATAQFENRSDDKKYNLDIIKDLSAKAAKAGAQVIAFHGMDDDQVKNGCSMIIDPFGDIIAECRSLGNGFVMTTINPKNLWTRVVTAIKKRASPNFTAILSASRMYRNKK